ncbi:MAG: hypothetical protein V2A74_00995, partial [bacterium]
ELSGSGAREQKLPDILGGIPVVQSALVLMMPSNFEFSDFGGSLNRVELVDLEVGEALRRAKKIEKVSEKVLYSEGEDKKEALQRLDYFQNLAKSKLDYARQVYQGVERVKTEQKAINAPQAKGEVAKKAVAREEQLGRERGLQLREAEESARKIASNYGQLYQIVQQEEAQAPQKQAQQQQQAGLPESVAPLPPPRPEAPEEEAAIAFPRSGDVFVFRQLQGTGSVSFKYSSRETSENRKDMGLGLLLIVVSAGLAYAGRRLFSSRRRVGLLICAVSLIAVIAHAGVDLAIVGFVVGAILLISTLKKSDSKFEETV